MDKETLHAILEIISALGAVTATLISLWVRLKAEQIHTLVNTNFSGLQKQLDVAQETIKGLKAVIATKDDTKVVVDKLIVTAEGINAGKGEDDAR